MKHLRFFSSKPIRKVVCLKKTSLLERAHKGLINSEYAKRIENDSSHLLADRENKAASAEVQRILQLYNVETKLMDNITQHDVRWADLVISVGGDGTFLRASHAFPDEDLPPLLGVNSSPSLSFGFFTATNTQGENFQKLVQKLVAGDYPIHNLWRMVVMVNGVPCKHPVLNDILFAHHIASAATRYRITQEGLTQNHLSSGVWISTSAGSTAAMHAAGGMIQPLTDCRLQFRVRELFKPSVQKQGEEITGGLCSDDFSLTSRMDKGVVFLDGAWESVDIAFGDKVTVKTCVNPLKWVTMTNFTKLRTTFS